jgi:hypothetical protein
MSIAEITATPALQLQAITPRANPIHPREIAEAAL